MFESTSKAASNAAYINPEEVSCLWPHDIVERVVGFKKSKRAVLIRDGKFPAPLRIDGKTVWDSRQICRWVKDRLAEAQGVSNV